ncbi:MAG: DNA-directed RNA polymerase subunit beta, partial [Clostridia bacterium]|nr:DNA-directed RNA polymerase subunit beta [Clostridia bacterium]
VFWTRIDKNRKLPITSLIRILGPETDAEILDLFGEDEMLVATLAKDTEVKNADQAYIEIYKKQRPGEPPTIDSSHALINGLFFDSKRYDLSEVGRYKFNKKLSIAKRIAGRKLTRPLVNELTGEIVVKAGKTLTREEAEKYEDAGVCEAWIEAPDGKEVKCFNNRMVWIHKVTKLSEADVKAAGFKERVRLEPLMKLADEYSGKALLQAIKDNKEELNPNHILAGDILASVNYLLNLNHGVGTYDDIDHLGNRRLRSVGELLQNQFRIGFSRMERVIRERMTTQDLDIVTPQSLVNIRPVTAAIKEFFGSSPLSQFMDQTNPLAELTHKRRMSALGPGGLSRDRANFEVRDVHYSHYGRLCPIETPEGPNIGLISYLATYARINDYGFIEAPYRLIDKKTGKVTNEVRYMTADLEDEYIIAQANEPLDEEGRIKAPRVTCRHLAEVIEVERERVDLIDVSPKMMVSVATAMIPFLENDDANRALMGSNMQRQAVPLLPTEAPVVATGIEYKAAVDSGTV